MNPAISVILNANPTQFVAGMGKAGAAVAGLGNTVTSVFGEIQKGVGKLNHAITQLGKGMVAGGAAIEAGLGAATKQAADFEVGMRNVNTITGLTEGGLSKLSNQVIEMSTKLPQSANELSAGLYDIASSGFQAADATTVLNASATAATAGLTDTATASNAIVAALNAYGMGADKANDVSDIFFQTVNDGVLTFSQLANQVGEFVGIGSAAGISLDEMSAALATMTVNGVTADQAGVSLNRTVQAFITPSQQMAETIKQLGYESGAAMLKSLGLKGSIEAVAKATGGDITSMQSLFQNVNALQGVLALTAGNGQAWAKIQEDITNKGNRAGAAQKAYAEQSKSLNNQIKLLKNQMQALVLTMGTFMLPVAKAIVSVMSTWAAIFNAIPTPIKALIAYGTALTGVLLVLGGVLVLTKLRTLLLEKSIILVARAMKLPMNAEWAGRLARALSGPISFLKELVAVVGRVRVGGVQLSDIFSRVGQFAKYGAIGLAAFFIGVTMATRSLHALRSEAKSWAAEQAAQVDTSSYAAMSEGVQKLIDQYNELGKTANQGVGRELAQNTISFFGHLIGLSDSAAGSISQAQAKQFELQKTITDMLGKMDQYRANVKQFGDQFGLTTDQVEKLAQANSIDLSGAADKVIPKLAAAYQASQQYGMSLDDVQAAAQKAAQEVDNLSGILGDFVSGSSALSSVVNDLNEKTQTATDIAYDQESASISVARAQQRLAQATADLNKELSRGIDLELQQAELDRDQAVLDHADAVQKEADAQDTLNRVMAAGGSPEAQAKALRDLKQAHIDVARTAQEQADAQDNLNNVGTNHAQRVADLQLSQREAQQQLTQAQKQAADAMSKAADKFSKAFGSEDAPLDKFTKKIEDQNKTVDDWEKNLFKIVQRGAPMEVVQSLVQMGVEGAPIVEKFANSTDTEFQRLSKALSESAKKGTKEYAANLNSGLAIAAIIAQTGGSNVKTLFMDQLNQIPALMGLTAQQIQAVAQSFGFTVTVTPTRPVAGNPASANPTGAAPIAPAQTPEGAADRNAPVAGNPGQTGGSITGTAANQFGTPDASDYGVGRALTGNGDQPWAPYVPDPAWKVGYYDPGHGQPYGMAQIWSIFGVYMGQYSKTQEGIWVWYGANVGDKPPPLSGSTKPPTTMARGGIISDSPILWAEAGREAYIPLSEGTPSRRTLGILSQAAGELGYAVTKMARGGIVRGNNAGMRQDVIVVQVPERWVAPTNVEVNGVDPESAMRWAMNQNRKRVFVRPGRNNN